MIRGLEPKASVLLGQGVLTCWRKILPVVPGLD
jgi:hypothetical protein